MLVKAITSLRPGAQWVLNGDSYDGLDWLDQAQEKPSLEEVSAEIIRLVKIDELNQYKSLRKDAYPSFADQFDLLYHGGYDAWKNAIQAVKTKHPKPPFLGEDNQ